MKTKISLDKPITEIDGTPTESSMAFTLASMLKASQTGDALKLLGWAIELHTSKTIEVDASDFEFLRSFVEKCPAWALIRGQIIREMIQQRDAQAAAKR